MLLESMNLNILSSIVDDGIGTIDCKVLVGVIIS